MNATIETVLFDIDGTLNDSNDAHARAWVDALGEAGFDIPFSVLRPLIGMGSDKLLPELGAGLSAESEPGKGIVARRRAIFLERYLPTVKPFAQARDLVDTLHEGGLTCIVASSASPEELDPLLRIAGVETSFDHVLTPDEVSQTKPDPDIIHAGLRWSRTDPARTVMIGDAPYDVEAARRGGVHVIAVRCGGFSDEALSGASAIYDSPAALLDAIRARGLDAVVASPGVAGESGAA